MKTIMMRLTICIILSMIFWGCQSAADINTVAHSVHIDAFMAKKMEADVLDIRKRKDESFKTSPDSPVPPEIRIMFQGLEYYPINWKYRFEGPVNRYPNPQPIKITTTSGEKRDAVKYGYILFNLDGKQFKLQVYRLLDLEQKNFLFVPFVDSNVGKETYPAGRYIDLLEKADGVYVIDFNNAYNPSCSYGGNFPCPVTPPENHLPIPIPAGEKNLPLAAKKEHKSLDGGRDGTAKLCCCFFRVYRNGYRTDPAR